MATLVPGEEESWLRMPPLLYIHQAAADHPLSCYVQHLAAVVGDAPSNFTVRRSTRVSVYLVYLARLLVCTLMG